MAYFLDLFSPETYEAFSKSDKSVSGFKIGQEAWAKRVHPGDKLMCYMTRLSRWVGILEVVSEYFIDDSPIFYATNDPFTVRFKVRALVWLPKELAIPIKEDSVWRRLSFTKDYSKTATNWTGKLRGSLQRIDENDAGFLEPLLLAQKHSAHEYPVDENIYRTHLKHRVKGTHKIVSVSIPSEDYTDENPEKSILESEVRESIKVQAMLASVGAQMNFKIWIPRNDRAAVVKELGNVKAEILDSLPLNYEEATLRTVEQIDVLWLKGRYISRAFEVEHTTSIYSGLLRMADLLALQPNLDVKLHIVAPDIRRDKVMQELERPVFSLLDNAPLAESCSFLSYSAVHEICRLKHLSHLADTVLEDYEERADTENSTA